MQRVIIWAGTDIYKVVDVPAHGSLLSYVDLYDLRDTFGDGAEIVKVSDDRYEIKVDAVISENDYT